MFVIILATYNGEKYIEQQLDSIVNQSCSDWFLLVCDDGSTDNTKDIVDGYVNRFPEKIKSISNAGNKHGAKDNFFYALEHAPVGDYYVFCDQDDVWTKDKLWVLEKEFEKLNGDVPALIYHNLKVVDNRLNVLNESIVDYTELKLNLDNPFCDLIKYNYIPGCGMSFNHALRNRLRMGGDRINIHDWWVIISCAIFGKIYYVDKPLTLYRQHDNNTIGIMSKAHGFGLIKRYFSVEKFKKVFALLRMGKRDSYNMLVELSEVYGDCLDSGTKEIIDNNLHYLTCRNKFAALAWGMRKDNMQKGFLKNFYYWTSTLS